MVKDWSNLASTNPWQKLIDCSCCSCLAQGQYKSREYPNHDHFICKQRIPRTSLSNVLTFFFNMVGYDFEGYVVATSDILSNHFEDTLLAEDRQVDNRVGFTFLSLLIKISTSWPRGK